MAVIFTICACMAFNDGDKPGWVRIQMAIAGYLGLPLLSAHVWLTYLH